MVRPVGIRILAIAGVAMLGVGAFGQSWGQQQIPWREYMRGTVCNITTPSFTVITSEAAFLQYWKRFAGDTNYPHDVDFSSEQLVAINLGQRQSGGYAVWVDSVVKPRPQDIVVTYVERRPSQRERVSMQISAPYVIFRMQRQGGQITYKPITIDGGDSRDPGVQPSPGIQPNSNVDWQNYLSGTVCQITTPKTTVITTQLGFLQYWKQLMGNNRIPMDVDFSTEQLVAINLGARATGGYRVAVTEVMKPRLQDIVITYVEQRPGRRDRVDNVKSSPFVIIKMRRQGGQITFKPMVIDGR